MHSCTNLRELQWESDFSFHTGQKARGKHEVIRVAIRCNLNAFPNPFMLADMRLKSVLTAWAPSKKRKKKKSRKRQYSIRKNQEYCLLQKLDEEQLWGAYPRRK